MMARLCLAVKLLSGRAPFRKGIGRLCLHSKARAELLVDGDQQGLEAAREAIGQLQSAGWTVQTTFYAAPGRVQNKKWKAFFQEPNVSFIPVPRSAAGEASDVAVERGLRRAAQVSDVGCLALLTADVDFVDAVREVTERGIDMLVFVPQTLAHCSSLVIFLASP